MLCLKLVEKRGSEWWYIWSQCGWQIKFPTFHISTDIANFFVVFTYSLKA